MPLLIVSRLCLELASLPRLLTPATKTRKTKKPKKQLTEERIAQCQLLDPPHIRIIHKVRIDVEEHRHVHGLPGIQPLLLEAEALDLAEVGRDLARGDAVGRDADDVLVAVVRGRVEGQRGLAGEHLDLALLGRELPGEHVGHGAVEGDADAFGGGDGLQARGGIAAIRAAVAGCSDGLTSPAGGCADLEEEALVDGRGRWGEGGVCGINVPSCT